MADFRQSFDKTMKWEGWALEDVPGDKGGMTCCGISRVYNPQWPGWDKIDIMMQAGKVELEKVAEDVMKFYETSYAPLDKVKSQKIADQIYQAFINCGKYAKKWAQKVCNVQGRSNLTIDGIIGFQTLSALNEITDEEFLIPFYEMQVQYYDAIIKKDPTQDKFRKGWYARAKDFI